MTKLIVDGFCPECGFPLIESAQKTFCLYADCGYNMRKNGDRQ